MKNSMYFIFGALLLLTSCGSGEWTDKDKEDFLKVCEEHGMSDCECGLKKTMDKYPNVNDFNDKGGNDKDLQKIILEECEGIKL